MTGIKINKEHFLTLSEKEQNMIIFETLENLLIQFESRKRLDTAMSGLCGLIGGFLSMTGKWIISKI